MSSNFGVFEYYLTFYGLGTNEFQRRYPRIHAILIMISSICFSIPIIHKIFNFIDEKPSDYDIKFIIIKANHLILICSSLITFIFMFSRLDDLRKLLFMLRRLVKASHNQCNEESS